jgi:hypothetical protein
VQIENLSESTADAYSAFLLGRSTTLLYQSWRYQLMLADLLGAGQRTVLVLDPDSRVRAALPLMTFNGEFGTVYNSLPFYGSNGGFITSDHESANVLKRVYNEIVSETRTASATLIENPLDNVDYEGLAYDFMDRRIGQLTPIGYKDEHAERLMQSFHYKTRNMIRKAEKLGVEAYVDNAKLDFIEVVHNENMMEIGGPPKSARFFKLVPVHFRPDADFRVYVAEIDGEPVAGILLFYFNQTVEYYTPVIRREFRETQALSQTIFIAMSDASREGYQWWNWGGTWSSQEGVYRFKKRWGTLDKPYAYYTKLNNNHLRELDQTKLLGAYPDFYVLPFSALLAPPITG